MKTNILLGSMDSLSMEEMASLVGGKKRFEDRKADTTSGTDDPMPTTTTSTDDPMPTISTTSTDDPMPGN